MSEQMVSVHFRPTPADLAEAFWHMHSDDQAEFYAALHRIAGYKLCMQTAYIVARIAELQAKGERDAVNGFRTLHSHAEAYLEVLVDHIAREGVPA